MPLPAGARPPCTPEQRRMPGVPKLARPITELKQCRAMSTGQARYFGQVRKRDWEVFFLRTGALLAPKVRPYSSLGQRPRNVRYHVPDLEEVVEPSSRWFCSTGLSSSLGGFPSPFCSGLVRSFAASSNRDDAAPRGGSSLFRTGTARSAL